MNADYHNLLSSANTLLCFHTENSLITGDCKQRPISYYLENACQILHKWKVYQNSIDVSFNGIDMRNDESIKQFENQISFKNLLDFLDQFLIFSTFLLIQR